ncbi:hypothetical protein EPR50_G00165140 [Perca flavescens]|uniref:Uncharacterized protein n=1 Tax=Perca flavescens TaxID=8167 RepID=A0A484CJH5_PERFV|nr:hypothetical protein EPR50_G00165140 [Perca flavescens]
MATTSSLLSRGLGLVLVEFQYEYQGRDGALVSIKPNQALRAAGQEQRPLVAGAGDHDPRLQALLHPAKCVKELPRTSPHRWTSTHPVPVPTGAASCSRAVPVPVPFPVQRLWTKFPVIKRCWRNPEPNRWKKF